MENIENPIEPEKEEKIRAIVEEELENLDG